jgi:signal peptidase I
VIHVTKTGYCDECGGHVSLNEDCSCANGHDLSHVSDIHTHPDVGVDAEDTPAPVWAVGVTGAEPHQVRFSRFALAAGAVFAVVFLGMAVLGVVSYERARQAEQSRIAAEKPAALVDTGTVPAAATLPTAPVPTADSVSTPIDVVSAMAPTIVKGQHYTLRSRGHAPKVGDIVLVKVGGSRVVRRVVGIAKDSISISEGWVYRNGTNLNEPYVEYNSARLTVGAMLVPKGAVFVIGDNRDQLSKEFWGLAKVGNIQGFVTP